MQIKLDTPADALYIRVTKTRVQKTIPTSDSFLVDVDHKGNVIGIEILNYSKIVPRNPNSL